MQTFYGTTVQRPERADPIAIPTSSDRESNALSQLDVPLIASQLGITPKLKVLYAADYVSEATRLGQTSLLWDRLQRMLPEYELAMPLCEGPLPDDVTGRLWFDHFRKS